MSSLSIVEVAIALVRRDGKLLIGRRPEGTHLGGMWEFPGGKVEPGESEVAALVRECDEELAVRVEVGRRVGGDVRLGHGLAVLKVYAARLLNGEVPRAVEHADLRWLAPDELDSVLWLPADAPIVAALHELLAG